MKKAIAIAAAALLTTAAHAGCYTVLDSKGNVILESSTPPVDMGYQLHQTVPYRYGTGSRLVFGAADEDCGEPYYAEIDEARPVLAGSSVKAGKKGKRGRRVKRMRKVAAAQ